MSAEHDNMDEARGLGGGLFSVALAYALVFAICILARFTP